MGKRGLEKVTHDLGCGVRPRLEKCLFVLYLPSILILSCTLGLARTSDRSKKGQVIDQNKGPVIDQKKPCLINLRIRHASENACIHIISKLEP